MENKKSPNQFWLFVIGVAVGAALTKIIAYIKEHKELLFSSEDHSSECSCGECGQEHESKAEPQEDPANEEPVEGDSKYNQTASDLSSIVGEINKDSWEIKTEN